MKQGALSRWREPGLLLGLALLLLLPTAWLVLTSGFSGLYGQDAYAYFDYATGPLRDSLRAGQPYPPFQWTPGYPLLVALLSFVLGVVPAAGQVVSLASGALVPVFTALLAQELDYARRKRFGLALPILAGLFVALNGHLWQPSVVVMSDATALAAATVGIWALARYSRQPQGKWLVLAAATLSFALFTRLAYVLVVAPAGIAAAILLNRQPQRQALRHALPAIVVAVIILLPIAWSMLASLLDSGQDVIAFANTGQIYKWNPLTALRRVHVSADGLLQYTLPNGLFYALTPARAFYFSPLIAVFILPGLWSVLRQRNPVSLLFLIGWPASVFLFHAGTPWQSFRFTLVYLPPLAVLAALGVMETLDYVRECRLFGRSGSVARCRLLTLVVGLWLLVGLSWMAAGAYRYTSNFIAHAQTNLDTAHWVEEQVPADAQLVTFGLTLTLEHESKLEVHDIYFMTPEELAILLGDERPVYLLLDLDSVLSQWEGRAPATNYHWLREGPGLQEVGREREYTLFVVTRQ